MAQEAKEGKNVVHDMTIWKQAIETELRVSEEWEKNWGFLKATMQQKSVPGTPREPGAASTLSNAGRAVLPALPPGSAAGSGSANPTPRGLEHRYNVMKRHEKTPRERFDRPVLESHKLGWRPSLERFGVNHHPLKRNGDLWPTVNCS